MEYLIDELKRINPDALHVVRTVLEARVGSAMVKSDNIELRSDVRRIYGILAKIIDHARDIASEEEVTTIKRLIVDDGEPVYDHELVEGDQPRVSESCID